MILGTFTTPSLSPHRVLAPSLPQDRLQDGVGGGRSRPNHRGQHQRVPGGSPRKGRRGLGRPVGAGPRVSKRCRHEEESRTHRGQATQWQRALQPIPAGLKSTGSRVAAFPAPGEIQGWVSTVECGRGTDRKEHTQVPRLWEPALVWASRLFRWPW